MILQLVVFDLAGTTVHDPGAVNDCFLRALRGAGLDADPAEVDAVMGLPKPQAIRILVDRHDRDVADQAQLDAIHRDFVARMIAYYRTDPAVVEVDGVSQLFADLRAAGVRVGIDTGFSRDIARTIFDRLGWERAGLIDGSVTSDEVTHGRPAPDMIRKLMSELGIADPSRVAKVGDASADLGEGTAAGCRLVVGVTWGTHTRSQLEAHPHTHLVDSVAELSHLLLET